MKRSELFFGLLKVPIDFLMTLLAFILAYKLRLHLNLPTNIATFPPWNEYLSLITLGSLLLILIFWLHHMYSFKTTAKLSIELKEGFKASFIWLMTIILYYFSIRQFPFSRLALGMSWIFTIVLVSTGRIILKSIQLSLLKKGIGQRRLILIGNNKLSQIIYQNLKKDSRYKIIGTIAKDQEKRKKGPKVIGNIHQLEKIIKKNQIEEIIQTRSHISEAQSSKILDFCKLNHLQYHFVPDIVELHQSKIDVASFSGIPLISLKPTPLEGWGKISKRTFDMILSLFALIILSPILTLISILIKKDSPGPILFNKLDDGSPAYRVGQHGKLFTCLKFRSMQNKTHNLRYSQQLEQKNIRKGTPLVKIKKDPRVTKIGKFIRKSSLDELPQLWNVLRGEMSLVGPRPHLPEEVAKYEKHHRFVLEIRPGISGLAQVSGRSDLSFEQEIKIDTYYIENWNILLDLKIIIKTIFVLFQKYEE